MTEFYRPETIGEAVRLMAEAHPVVIAGGTDLMIRLRNGLTATEVMDLTGVEALEGVSMHGNEMIIGAMTTHARIEADEMIREYAYALWQAAGMIGSPQIRNMGTIGGNIANASPSADTLPAIYALGAKVELISRNGRHSVPVAELFTGPKQTILGPDELIGWIRIPVNESGYSYYTRLGTRSSLSISKVGVAVYLDLETGTKQVKTCRIALGAVAPTVIYAGKAMDFLTGKELTGETIQQAAMLAASDARPIDDIRSTAFYRQNMVRVLTKRAITAILSTVNQ